jgi:hypothetical protein
MSGVRARQRGNHLEVAMSHKFMVGQSVVFAGMPSQLRPNGQYQIVRQLPPDMRGEPLYRIKAASENYERMVRESQIKRT